ncbi:ComEC/Rec2 family competence protein [Asaccharospora irregularis]|uniref:Competence protein ComEC n=1 Tax=Asaccharospora irregularis DSM 2635 TaxID=1121321 RepID=A0A1M5M5D1_9FIRM|nr:ComEC/Rec2 family competence protein [Asaccharospora irregularis]SHG71913.1 competence protein ComEC [Asaccharospora irregularis DSM 2635]
MKKKVFLSIIIIISFLTGCNKDHLLSIHIIDVGQGDSILIQTPNKKNILVDGGDEDAQHIVKNYLKRKKVKSLDIIIATHPDTDHIGSLDYIVENFSVKSIYMPEQSVDSESYINLVNSCNSKKLTPEYLYKGDNINIEKNIDINVLSPSYIQGDNNLNSIVFTLDFNQNSFLFTGDAEEENESDIINSFDLDYVDFLKVGHHGSNSSTTDEFIKETSPDVAAISCGYKNSYGHPHKQTLENLSKHSVLTYRTDQIGDIVFFSDGQTIFTKKNYKHQ